MLTTIYIGGTEPVTLAEAKVAARVDNDLGGSASSLDAFITGAISAAREQAEQLTGRRYRQRIQRAQFVDWPAADCAIHVNEPSLVTVTFWNGSAWVAVATGAFVSYPLSPGGTGIAPAVGASWPALVTTAGGPRVRVDLTSGPTGAGGEVPVSEAVKLYITASVASWVNAGEALVNQQLARNPMLDSLLDADRLWA